MTLCARCGKEPCVCLIRVNPGFGILYDGSSALEVFDFCEALKRMRDGAKVARRGWNGKGMWAAAQYPDAHSKMTRPYLYLKAVDGSIGPWQPNNIDLFAADWVAVREGEHA